MRVTRRRMLAPEAEAEIAEEAREAKRLRTSVTPLVQRRMPTTKIKVATYNAPTRYSFSGRKSDIQRLANRGVTVIALQEIRRRNESHRLEPSRWSHWQPTRYDNSSALIWDKREWRVVRRGAYRLSSGRRGYRGYARSVVWAWMRHRRTGRYYRFGGIHMIWRAGNTGWRVAEWRYMEPRAAYWLGRGGRRVLMGDMNGTWRSSWMKNIRKVGNVSLPEVQTRPNNNVYIDQVWRPKRDRRGRSIARPRTLFTQRGSSDHLAVAAEIKN